MEYRDLMNHKSRSKKKGLLKYLNCTTYFLKKYVTFGVLISVLLIMLYIDKQDYRQWRHKVLPIFQRTLRLSDSSINNIEQNVVVNSWQSIGDPSLRYKVFSAYFDPRVELLKSFNLYSILNLRVNTRKFHCVFKYANNINEKNNKVRAVEVTAIHENFNLEYSAFFIVCPLKQDVAVQEIHLPVSVSVCYDLEPSMRNESSFVAINYPKDVQQFFNVKPVEENLAICVAPMHHDYYNALRVAEFFEIYKILGASMVYIYDKSVTTQVKNILKHYETNRMAQIFTWNLYGYGFEEELRYEGIFAGLNDCLYRATFIDKFKYIAIVDFDEILMPLRNDTKTLLEFLMLKDEEHFSSFNFQGAFFFSDFVNDLTTIPNNTTNKYLHTQCMTTRLKYPCSKHSRSKYIVKGHSATELGNHFVWNTLRDTTEYAVPIDEGLMFHYRNKCVDNFCYEPTVVDEHARIYSDNLWKNVDNVCNQTFANGQCPRYI
ncbi:unnamed protein product [Diamesa serratosioi]